MDEATKEQADEIIANGLYMAEEMLKAATSDKFIDLQIQYCDKMYHAFIKKGYGPKEALALTAACAGSGGKK